MPENARGDSDFDRGEFVLYQARPSMIRNHPIAFVLLILFPLLSGSRSDPDPWPGILGSLFISAFILTAWWIQCRSMTLTISDRRVTLEQGPRSRDSNEVMLADIRNVWVRQGPLQRLLSVGMIGISSSGQSDVEIQVAGIPHPAKARELINAHRGR